MIFLDQEQIIRQMVSTSTMSSDKPSKLYSCVRCYERKVKCDKKHPCSDCVRSKRECIFRVPSAPRRKKKRTPQDEVLLARLKHYEDLLRRQGIDIITTPVPVASTSSEKDDAEQEMLPSNTDPYSGSSTQLSDSSRGGLIMEQGKTRFFENNLWSSVSAEFQQPREGLADSSSENETETIVGDSTDFLLGSTPVSHGRQDHHPPPDQILKLWQLFLKNVDPVTKIIHRPTLDDQISKASSDLKFTNKGLEALMFSIYSSAITSITDRECQTTFGELRKPMLLKYRRLTTTALSRVRFLGTSDIVVLQAFVLHLLVMREIYDARTLWTLVGVASRVAQGLGIHRDGTTIGLPPFETEMRRRLWWQISLMEFRSAELTGSGRYGDLSLSDTLPPTNVNDEDIWPGMKNSPVAHTRPTEIIACLLRCESGTFWKEKLIQRGVKTADYGAVVSLSTAFKSPWGPSIKERDQFIDELEQRLEDKFLRYCDVSVPIQFMASVIGRGMIASMRLMAHHPKRYEEDSNVPAEERRLLWDLCMKILESDNMAHSSKLLQRYKWHTKVYFHWHSLIYLLGELKKQPLGEEAENAWAELEEVFQHHSNFITEPKKPLHVAIGSLCMKAYDAREKALEKLGALRPTTAPDFIMQLRWQRRKPTADVQPQAGVPQPDLTSVPSFSIANRPDSKEGQQLQKQQAQFEPRPQHQTYIPQHLQQQISQPSLMPGQTIDPDWQTPALLDDCYDPTLSLDFINDDTQLDWTQWDNLIQDFGLRN